MTLNNKSDCDHFPSQRLSDTMQHFDLRYEWKESCVISLHKDTERRKSNGSHAAFAIKVSNLNANLRKYSSIYCAVI